MMEKKNKKKDKEAKMKKRYLQDIENFIFLEDELEPADIIFIPGNGFPQMAEEAAKLYQKGFAKWLLPSGRYSINLGHFGGVVVNQERYCGDYKTEWEFLTDVLMKNGVPKERILKEDQATYTYENAIFSRNQLKEKEIAIKKAIICCHAFHARRCQMYYEQIFPTVKLMIHPVDTGITKQNWLDSDEGAQKVFGEVERCGIQMWMIWEDIKQTMERKK